MVADVLTARQLSRATLHRQHLLERVAMPADDLIHHLVGMQAQNPRDPYVALWSRLVDFRPAELEQLLLDRRVVRLVVQRGTVHAVTDDDCLVLRPLAQPILTQQLFTHSQYKHSFDDIDLDAVMTVAAELLAEQPHNSRQLRQALAERFPAHDAGAMAFACRNLLAFVQVPPRGLWARGGEVVGTTAEAWLGRPLVTAPSVDEVMLRYLAAFGPASVQDATTWSRYTGLREVFERLRPQLRTYRDHAGHELFDVPERSIPESEMPAPVRFLPEYDNVLLAHADRRRFVDEDFGAAMPYERLGFLGSVLVDGSLVGGWRHGERRQQTGRQASGPLNVYVVGPLGRADTEAVEAEGRRLRDLVAPGSGDDVRVEVVGP